jgi:integrase/recombinase XerD
MSIRAKDNSGRKWVIDVTHGRGERHKETFEGTKEAAEILHAQIKRRLGALKGQYTVAEIAAKYLADLKKPGRSMAQSPNTYRNTEHQVNILIRHFGRFCIDSIPEIELIRFRNLRLEEIAARGRQTKTRGVRAVNLNILMLQSLNKFAREQKLCTEKIPGLKPLKYKLPPPKPLTRDEMWGVIEQLHGVRRIMALCMYCAGGRKFEVFKLCWGDIDFSGQTIYTVGKGGVPEFMDLVPELDKALQDYHESFKEAPSPADLVFPPTRGAKRWSITKALKAAALRAGVTKTVTEHVLRHSFATHLLEDHRDLKLVQEKLRHAKLDMALRYTKVARKRMRQASVETFQKPDSVVVPDVVLSSRKKATKAKKTT